MLEYKILQVALNSGLEQSNGKEAEADEARKGKRHEVPEATKFVKLKKRSKKGKRR